MIFTTTFCSSHPCNRWRRRWRISFRVCENEISQHNEFVENWPFNTKIALIHVTAAWTWMKYNACSHIGWCSLCLLIHASYLWFSNAVLRKSMSFLSCYSHLHRNSVCGYAFLATRADTWSNMSLAIEIWDALSRTRVWTRFAWFANIRRECLPVWPIRIRTEHCHFVKHFVFFHERVIICMKWWTGSDWTLRRKKKCFG